MDANAQLRKHLGEQLRVGADFDAFCHDCFPSVFRRYGNDMDRTTKTTLLLLDVGDPELIGGELDKWLHRFREGKQRQPFRMIISMTLLFVFAASSTLLCQRLTNRSVPLSPSADMGRQPSSSVPTNTFQQLRQSTEPAQRPVDQVPALRKLPVSAVERRQEEGSRSMVTSGGHAKSGKAITNIFTGNIAKVIQNY